MIACLGCQGSAQPGSRNAPDSAWEGWWPAGQWTTDDPPPSEAVVHRANRTWTSIEFHPLATPWGEADVEMRKVESAPGLHLWLSFTRPESEAVWIRNGEIEASVVRGPETLVAAPVNGPPTSTGGVGRMGYMTTLVAIQFPWWPDDLEDCWIRLKMKDRSCWILAPYGFGADDSAPVSGKVLGSGKPELPLDHRPGDSLASWNRVAFSLGGAFGATAIFSNSNDAEAVLRLRRRISADRNAWALTRPRTTLAIGIPGSRVLTSRCVSVTRDESNAARVDRFQFDRQPGRARAWGLLRVTVEDEVFERAIPSSLFHYGHGAPSER